MRIKTHTHGTHINIHEGVDRGSEFYPSPTPTPCLRPPRLERAKFPLFPSFPFSPNFLPLSPPLLPLPLLLPPEPSPTLFHPSSPISLLPCPPTHICCWNTSLHVFCFTTDDIKQKLYWTHIFVLEYCIVCIVVRSYTTEEMMYSYNQLKLQNFRSKWYFLDSLKWNRKRLLHPY